MRRASRFALWLLLTFAASLAGRAHAQQQERGLAERIQHPDMTLAYHPAEKHFGGSASSAPWNKRAAIRSFPSGRRAAVKSYTAKGFTESRGFASGTFAGRDRAAAGTTAAAGADRTFSTRDVAVREARDARKTVAPRGESHLPVFVPVGKRQDSLDEQQRVHPMTIDEVRELLNKSR